MKIACVSSFLFYTYVYVHCQTLPLAFGINNYFSSKSLDNQCDLNLIHCYCIEHNYGGKNNDVDYHSHTHSCVLDVRAVARKCWALYRGRK